MLFTYRTFPIFLMGQLEKDSETLQSQVKQLIHQQQKTRALLVLKLRRFKDSEADKVDAELMSVLEMIDTVEWEHTNMEVLRALKAGTASLNKLHEEMSLDDVAELLEETNEAIEMENNINEMLAGQMDIGNDEELERELAELMGETVTPAAASTKKSKLDLPAVPNAPILPSVPTSSVASNDKNINTTTSKAAPVMS